MTDGQAKPFGTRSFEPQEDLALVRGWRRSSPRSRSPRSGSRRSSGSSARAGRRRRPPARQHVDLLRRLRAGDPRARGRPRLARRRPADGRDARAPRARRRVDLRLGGRLRLDVQRPAVRRGRLARLLPVPHRGRRHPAHRRQGQPAHATRWCGTTCAGSPRAPAAARAAAATPRSSPRPPYQDGLGLRNRRAVPDVAAHASMFPAWPVNLGRFWEPDGGTSAASPLVAAGFAVVSARERAAGRPPLGPVNGLLYDVRATAPDLLYDIVAGDNGYTRKVPARHAARATTSRAASASPASATSRPHSASRARARGRAPARAPGSNGASCHVATRRSRSSRSQNAGGPGRRARPTTQPRREGRRPPPG